MTDTQKYIAPKAGEVHDPLVKRALRSVYWAGCRLTSPLRTLPDFLIIGAQKAGTTSLFFYLQRHPDVFMARPKEVHFFDYQWSRGANWYRKYFPLAAAKQASLLAGEASPYYLFHPQAPKRVAALTPEAKIIVILRNPIDRAYSQYKHSVRAGVEPLSFEDALEAEESRIGDEYARALSEADYEGHPRNPLPIYSYKARGRYAEQLHRWFDFFPREQIHIIDFSQFTTNTASEFERVVSFLGGRTADVRLQSQYNVDGSGTKMARATRQSLSEYFRPYNDQLYALLEYDFEWK